MPRNFRKPNEPPPPIPTLTITDGLIVDGLPTPTDQTADYWKCVADRLRLKLEESRAANKRNRSIKLQLQKRLDRMEGRVTREEEEAGPISMADDYPEAE